MKIKSAFMVSAALAASLGIHLAGFMLPQQPKVKIKGGSQVEIARLGNSFADMSSGVSKPTQTTEILDPVEDISEDQTSPETTEVLTSKAAAVSAEMLTKPDVKSTPIHTVENTVNPVVASTRPQIMQPVLNPVTVTPTPKTITAIEPVLVQNPTQSTRRPVARKPRRKVVATIPRKPVRAKPAKTKPRKPVTQTVAPKPARPVGANAAVRGQASGTKTGQATQSSQRGKRQSSAGNAAVANYGGKVMRKIQRTRKERAGAKGRALVGFKVSSSGAATSVRILRSSGSAKIDSIAIRHIKRAAPFPRPPKGARRSFSITFVSRR